MDCTLARFSAQTMGAILALSIAACGETKEDTADSDTQPRDSDTADTSAEDPVPVWEQQHIETSATLTGVYASGKGVYAVGTESTYFTYKVATGWVQSTEVDIDGEDFNGLWGIGAEETLVLVAVANAGKVVTYRDQKLDIQDLGTNNFQAVHGPNPDLLYAVGWGGVYKFQDSQWHYDETFPGDVRLNDIWATEAAAFGVGEDGAIVAYLAAGWEKMESNTSEDLYSIYGTSENNLYAVGANGTILHFDGSSWTVLDSGVNETLWSVFAWDANTVIVVGGNGIAIRLDGDHWTSLPTGVENNLYAVHCSSAKNCWAVGNRGMTLQYNP